METPLQKIPPERAASATATEIQNGNESTPLPLLDRRDFVLRTAGLAGFPFVMSACGGANNAPLISSDTAGLYYTRGISAGTLTITSVRGKVILPDGALIRVTAIANLASVGTTDATGAFSFASAAEGPLMTIGYAQSGLPVLYGFLQAGDAQLSAQSTAVVLAYEALGIAAYPPEVQALYLNSIVGSMSLAFLTKAIETQISVYGEQWLVRLGDAATVASQHDSDYYAAILKLQGALSPSALTAPASVASSRSSALMVRSNADGISKPLGAILDKTDIISGLQVSPDGIGSVTVTNYFRRRVSVYVDRVSYRAVKSATDVSFPGVILPQPVKIPPVAGVSNLLANLGQLFAGQGNFYDSVVSAPWSIPVNPSDAGSTTYTVTVVGLGESAGDFGLLTQVQADGWWDVVTEALFVDFVMPILTGIVLPNSAVKKYIDKLTGFAGTSGAFKDILNAINSSPKIRASAQSGKIADAAWDTLLLIVKTDTLKNVFLQGVGDFITSTFGVPNAPFGLNGPLLTITDRAKWLADSGKLLLSYISNVNVGLQAFDSIVTGLQIAYCNRADIFTIQETNAVVKINPLNPFIDYPTPVNLVISAIDAEITPGVLLTYNWSCGCLFGDISDGIHTNSANGNAFNSSSNMLTYAPNSRNHGLGGDSDVVTGKIFLPSKSKTVPIGQATCTITYNAPLSPVNPNLDFGANQTFTASVSTQLPSGVTYQWTVTGGHGTLSSAQTSTPTVVYTAATSAAQGVDVLSLKVIDGNGRLLTQGSTNIQVGNASGIAISPSTYTFKVPRTEAILHATSVAGVPSDALYTWTCKKGMMTLVGQAGGFTQKLTVGNVNVYYRPPAPPADGSADSDIVTLTITSPSGQNFGTAVATMTYGGLPFLRVIYPDSSEQDNGGSVSFTGPQGSNASLDSYRIDSDFASFFLYLPKGTPLNAGQSFTLDSNFGAHTIQPQTFQPYGYVLTNWQNSDPNIIDFSFGGGTLSIGASIPSPSGSGKLVSFAFSLSEVTNYAMGPVPGFFTGNGVYLQ